MIDVATCKSNFQIIKLIHLVFATLGPTLEFQLSLKSYNLASWPMKGYDYTTGTSHQPPSCNTGS